MKRIVIIGNSGSGKSFLARRISAASGIQLIHLDRLFWLPGAFNQKRPVEIVDAEIASKAGEDEWVVEGVFGDLSEKFLHCADYLIWLDLPWPVCHANLMERGSESFKQCDTAQA
jgi:adenylate kinase family enzyme